MESSGGVVMLLLGVISLKSLFVVACATATHAPCEIPRNQIVASEKVAGSAAVCLRVRLISSAKESNHTLAAFALPGPAQDRGVNVVARQGVTVLTSRLSGVAARWRRVAAQCVLPMGDRPTVMWVAAASCTVVAGEMVKLLTFGDRVNFSDVPNAVHQSAFRATPNLRVPADGPRADPNVAPALVLDPARRVPSRTPRNEHADHFAGRFRYFRMYRVAYFRRHSLHLPSRLRFFASRCPRRQYMAFMPSNVSQNRITRNG